jgi:hypothetical protein
MPFVLKQREGWTEDFKFEVQNDFKTLREGVNHTGSATPSDAFMWEHFTTKKYYDNGELKRIGEIYTPWPSWVLSASTKLTDTAEGHKTLAALFRAINSGINYFNLHPDEAVDYISSNLDYTDEDARAWLKTVQFASNVSVVDEPTIVKKTIQILQTAGVLELGVESRQYFVSTS